MPQKKQTFDIDAIAKELNERGSVAISYKKCYVKDKHVINATLRVTSETEMRKFVDYILNATKETPVKDLFGAEWYLL